MARIIRKTAILAKIETTYGTDATPTGAADAILISNASFEVQYNNVSRDLIRPYLGGSEELAGTRFVQATFEVEYAPSGTAATAPAWGKLLRACGMAEASLTTPARVEYTPVSATFSSLTIYYHLDGVLRKMLGCIGTVEFKLGEGERPVMAFTFWGLDGGVTATADPTVSLTAFKTPTVISDVNSGDITLGGTYAAGVITGGTVYPSRGLQVSLNNQVSKIQILGGQMVELTQRDVSGSMQLQLTAAQEVTFRSDINANAVTSLSFQHGTGAGSTLLLTAPAVQRTNPKDVDYEGQIHMSMDLRFVPGTAGNDEIRIVQL
jgi:hypothetical protein